MRDMGKIYKTALLLMALVVIVMCTDRRITVDDSECGRSYNAEDEHLYFVYRGDQLKDECLFTIKKYSEKYKMICAMFDKFRLNSCHTTIEFRPSPNTVKTHNCKTTDLSEYCKELEKLVIVFTTNGSRTTDEADLKVYFKEDASGSFSVGSIILLVMLLVCFLAAAAIFYIRFRKRAKKEKKERKKREKREKELREAEKS